MKRFINGALFLCLVVTAVPAAHAKNHPHKPALGNGGPAAVSGVEQGFDCGTYKGTERENLWMKEVHKQQVKKMAIAGTSPAPAVDFIYNDVWIVEDDGTLLFSGLNQFDTDNQTFRFTPNVSGGYDVTSVAFSWDATPVSTVATGDDGAVNVSMLFSFDFGGALWTDMYVGGNGIVGFGANPNPSGFYDNDDFFGETAMITPLYADLNPAAGGSVKVKSEATKYTVWWDAVPEFGTANLNSMQLVIRDDDSFDISFNGISTLTQSNGAPIFVGFRPAGASPTLEVISYSDDLPYTASPGAGVYESFLNITNPLVNEVALFQKFYQQFPDEFFQLVFFSTFVQTMGGFANERNIENGVTGIGLGIFDFSSQYGSNGILESRCNMNRLAVWPVDPAQRFFSDGNNFLTIMGQEAGHRWGAFVHFEDQFNQESNLILGRADAHWSYFLDNDHSSLEGGNWNLISPNTYNCPTQIDYFHALDEYTFGLRLPEEVAPTFFVSSASNDLLSNRDDGTPAQGAIAVGTPVTVTIDDIIAIEGPRTPTEANEDKDLRQGFILIHPQGQPPTQQELDQVAGYRSAWEDYFEVSVDGRITCNTSLTSNYDVAVVCGQVLDKTTQLPVPDFTAESVERSFVQVVPAGGRYTFRYQAFAGAGSAESATIIVTAPGYYPDTLGVNVDYGTEAGCDNVFLTPIPSDVRPGTPLPNALYPNYPNPFNPTTTIRFDLVSARDVRLEVFDVRGALVRTLVEGTRQAGPNEVVWDGLDNTGNAVSSGVYVYRIQAGNYIETRKMVLVK